MDPTLPMNLKSVIGIQRKLQKALNLACILSTIALTMVSLEAHRKILKGNFQERTVELLWAQEPSITLQIWF